MSPEIYIEDIQTVVQNASDFILDELTILLMERFSSVTPVFYNLIGNQLMFKGWYLELFADVIVEIMASNNSGPIQDIIDELSK